MEPDAGKLFPGQAKHILAEVQPGNMVIVLEIRDVPARAAGQNKQIRPDGTPCPANSSFTLAASGAYSRSLTYRAS
jgi:hypothetical protein